MIGMPHNVEIESTVLGLMFFDTGLALDVISKCSLDDFYSEDNRIIYKGVKGQIEATGQLDIPVLSAKINKSLKSIDSLVSATNNLSDYNVSGKIAELKKYSGLRRALRVSLETIERIKEGTSPEEILTQIEKDLFILTQNNETSVKQIWEYNKYVAENYTMFQKSQYLTGLDDIDRNLMLHNGLMFILAGAPGSGKTSFVTNFILELSQKSQIPTCIFSQEASGEMINYRLGHTFGGEGYAGYLKGSAKFEDVPLYIDDTAGLTLMRLRSKVLRYVKRYGIKLFAVDYLQLMTGEGENQNAKVGNLSKGITALAKETGTCWIVLSQLTKEGLKRKEPTMADLRDSGQIAQDARGVYFLFQNPDYENAVTFKCEKQNFGKANWRAEVYFDKGRNKFSNLEKRELVEREIF